MQADQQFVDQIREQFSTLYSNFGSLRNVAEEKKNEQVLSSIDVLKRCLDSIESAIDKNWLISLPTVLLSDLTKTVTDVAGIAANSVSDLDSHGGSLTNMVNLLHAKLWTSRLIDPEAELRAYKDSVGKLDSKISDFRTSMAEIKKSLKLVPKLEAAASVAMELKDKINASKIEADTEKDKINQLLAETTGFHNSATERLTSIQSLLDDSQARNSEVKALEADLKKWHAEITTTLENIEAIKGSTITRLDDYDEDIVVRQNELNHIKDRIEEQFRLVSSGALAKSFGIHDTKRRRASLFWAIAAITSYVCFVGVASWQAKVLLESEQLLSWESLSVRLMVAAPYGILIWFLTVQFGIARRIQETYAFKETVASSFDAYRDLVEKITKDPELKDNAAYADFIRQTIERLYQEPQLGKVKEDHPPHSQAAQDVAGFVKDVTKLVEKVKT